jgi:hypothetical protein
MRNRKAISRALAAAVVLIVLGTLCAPWASAQCAYVAGSKVPRAKLQPSYWQKPLQDRSGALLLVSDDDSDGPQIVGLWKVLFVAQGNAGIPDGVVIDFGYSQWHSDGTEILNSGSRPPENSNFCLGVWKKNGGSKYQLNHFALSWQNGSFLGPANIRESVVLDHGGNSYSGSFTIDQFDQAGNTLAHVVGKITATRVTVDTQP